MSLVGPDGLPITSTHFRKADPPKLGPKYGSWTGRDVDYVQLPGGAFLTFDLSKLTLADYRAMRPNPQINASLSILAFMLHQLDWWIDCDNKKIKEAIETNLRAKWSQLIRAISQSYWAGYSPCALEYVNNPVTKYIELDKIKDLLPEDCVPNWKEVEGYAPEGLAKPKFYLYDGIKQGDGLGLYAWNFYAKNLSPLNPNQVIPPENTFWYPILMENGDYRGRKLLKSAFTPWYFSNLMHLFANRYYERFGEPTPIGRFPADTEFTVTSGSPAVPARDAIIEILSSLRSRGVVALPNDKTMDSNDYEWDIKYLESQMRGADFERYMTRLDEEMSLAIFTPILLFKTADVGSNNLGVQHVQTFMWQLNALAADMKEYIDSYIVKRLHDFNFGANAPAATWQWKALGKENAETIRSVITELVRGGTVKPDLEQLGKAVGMTLEEVQVVTEDPANPDAPAADPRTSRARPEQRRQQPRGTDEPRATGREISARIRSQVQKAYKNNVPLKIDIGYRRKMLQAIQDEEAVDSFYAVMGECANNLQEIGLEGFDGPNHFMTIFDGLLDIELKKLCDA